MMWINSGSLAQRPQGHLTLPLTMFLEILRDLGKVAAQKNRNTGAACAMLSQRACREIWVRGLR